MSYLEWKNMCLFYGKESIFSNMYYSPFTINGITYINVEQWFMSSKSKLFGDDITHKMIMCSKNPYEIKKLGRQVKNFNESLWKKKCKSIMKKGIVAKFTSNKHLLSILKSTGNNLIAECSIYDKYWGNGLNIKNSCIIDPKLWPGKNNLGKILTSTRDQIFKKEREESH
jgi:ribA/ribD-fused uncharacterized protein